MNIDLDRARNETLREWFAIAVAGMARDLSRLINAMKNTLEYAALIGKSADTTEAKQAIAYLTERIETARREALGQ